MTPSANALPVMTSAQLLEHWQGHRRLTRRVIEAFPDDKLFSYALGGMRPFAALAKECLGMAVPSLHGVITGEWDHAPASDATTKVDILKLWDQATADIDRMWPTIPPARFQVAEKAFGQWDMTMYGLLLYVIDNEIHHRGQGYVYLRSLGIEPPPFYDRS
jgi:uncharacterized damage-inducible protein DinB